MKKSYIAIPMFIVMFSLVLVSYVRLEKHNEELEEYNIKLKNKIEEVKDEIELLEEDIEDLIVENEELLNKKIDEEKLALEIKQVEENKWKAFVSATFRLETGNSSSSLWLNRNNPGGIKCGSEYCYYDSPEQGMSALKSLLEHYVNKYGYDFEKIRSIYAPNQPEDYPKFITIYNEEYNELVGVE